MYTKMRTSYRQYEIMVEFMEKHGDLSKPTGGPRGRHFITKKWEELVSILNAEGSGFSRSDEKWRKVWSDFKNNTKKKLAKINKAASTGGIPLQLSLTDLENKVIEITKAQPVTSMAVEETNFQQDEQEGQALDSSAVEEKPQEHIDALLNQKASKLDFNKPGTSSHSPVPSCVSPPASPEPPVKKQKREDIVKLFLEYDRNAKEYAREHDRIYERFETERLRQLDKELQLREYEIRERVRQRDTELQLQAQWLEFMKEAMNLISRHIGRQDKNKL